MRELKLSPISKPALGLALLLAFVAVFARSARVRADEGWVINSYDVAYTINTDGTIDVVEDIAVAFGAQQKHGIFRDITVEQKYDDTHNRQYKVDVVSVDNGGTAWKYTTSREGAAYRIKIGDPDKTVSGPQRYRIRYRLTGALNAQQNWDEFFWNVTGLAWDVPIDKVNVVVSAPKVQDQACYQGPEGSRETCTAAVSGNQVAFSSTRRLTSFQGVTVVVAMPKGTVTVPPPMIEKVKSPSERVRDALGLHPLQILVGIVVGIVSIGGVLRYWWLNGRDRWLGDAQYLSGNTTESRKPLGAKDTVVVEYSPPQLEDKRPLKPAEIGTLIYEKADTQDVSATIVDLAVKGYMRITEQPKEGLLGHKDYKLDKLKPADADLLGYEVTLFESLFDSGDSVELSTLKNKFYSDLADVKTNLYAQVTTADQFFAANPETVRTVNYVIAGVITAIGAAGVVLLATWELGAVMAVPLALAGLLMLALAHAMPRRTGKGREYYRRSLGFRLFMTVAETDRQKFNEEANIFEKYLPYAIVYNCVDKWAKTFEGLDGQPSAAMSGWYVGPGAFLPLAFSQNINDFSSSLSSTIASTPGSSGGSGFGGGGFSGGGGGGGGGGGW